MPRCAKYLLVSIWGGKNYFYTISVSHLSDTWVPKLYQLSNKFSIKWNVKSWMEVDWVAVKLLQIALNGLHWPPFFLWLFFARLGWKTFIPPVVIFKMEIVKLGTHNFLFKENCPRTPLPKSPPSFSFPPPHLPPSRKWISSVTHPVYSTRWRIQRELAWWPWLLLLKFFWCFLHATAAIPEWFTPLPVSWQLNGNIGELPEG